MLILPGVSHFAVTQKSEQNAAAISGFLKSD